MKGLTLKLRLSFILIMVIVLATACGGDDDKDGKESASTTPVPPTPTPLVLDNVDVDEIDEGTTAPTFTPQVTTSAAGVELLGADPDTCVNEESYTEVMGFPAMYHELTTENSVSIEMSAPDIGVFVSQATDGENKDGEEGWGFYPIAYELPDNTAITVTLTTYAGPDDTSEATSVSVLTYDCTTGEIISSSYSQFSE